jgi:hypothetical protein
VLRRQGRDDALPMNQLEDADRASARAGSACPSKTERPTFVIVLRPEPGIDGVRALRAALKTLLRSHGLRAVRIAAEAPSADPGLAERQAPTRPRRAA